MKKVTLTMVFEVDETIESGKEFLADVEEKTSEEHIKEWNENESYPDSQSVKLLDVKITKE